MPDSDATYEKLVTLLHPIPPRVLEIDILPTFPSSTPQPQIQYSPSDNALAITKPALIHCFQTARKQFFASRITNHEEISSPSPLLLLDRAKEENEEQQKKQQQQQQQQQTLRATSVLLLLDPSHYTALNWRKRYFLHTLLLLAPHDSRRKHSQERNDDGARLPPPHEKERQQQQQQKKKTKLLETELLFLETLLTSPLPKHTKAFALWTHRLWVVRTFLPVPLLPTAGGGGKGDYHAYASGGEDADEQQQRKDDMIDRPSGTQKKKNKKGGQVTDITNLWKRELRIVMNAGERHPRNYYGWNYARDVYRFLVVELGRLGFKGQGQEPLLERETVEGVKKWCFMHPRDVSGWAFLVWVLERVCFGYNNDGGSSGGGEGNELMRKVVWETKQFAREYEWQGESVEWFLRTLRDLSLIKHKKRYPNM